MSYVCIEHLNKAKMKNSTNPIFEADVNYTMSFIGDSNLKPVFTCIKRTAKTATFKGVRCGEVMTRRIRNYGDGEFVIDGNYSMAPVIRAKRVA